MHIFKTFEIRVVAEWRNLWRLWSLRLNSLGILLLSLSETVGQTWNAMPDDLRHMMPALQTVSLVVFVAGFVARFIAQPSAGVASSSQAAPDAAA